MDDGRVILLQSCNAALFAHKVEKSEFRRAASAKLIEH
jgi:hypothetical protein